MNQQNDSTEVTLNLWKGKERKFKWGAPVVILGANGAGKTRLGVNIEERNDINFKNTNRTAISENNLVVHRISAQKSLSIPEGMSFQGAEDAVHTLLIGGVDVYANKQNYRYQAQPVTHLLNDYDKVLGALFAKSNRQLEENNKTGKPHPITTFSQQVEDIWNDLLPSRTLSLEGNQVRVSDASGEDNYHGKDMSDGERVILYMLAAVISMPPYTVIIIDEPELHIHKAIMKKLWDKLEQHRQDCLFIYITHDLDFATTRNCQEIFWVKYFDGKKTWNVEFITTQDYVELPNELVFEMMGTQKKILFVEGQKNSLDYQLYYEFYRDQGYHVIPCGGCQQVIKIVKAKQGYTDLDSIQVYGIIDRDFRTDNEINALKKENVFCLKVAEVENLFIVPELLQMMQQQLGCDGTTIQTAEQFIHKLFDERKGHQISQAFVQEMDWLSTQKLFRQDGKNIELTVDMVKEHIDQIFEKDKIEKIFNDIKNKFEKANTIKDILTIFNDKELSKKIDCCFGLQGSKSGGEYQKKILKFLQEEDSSRRTEIISKLKPYLPELPEVVAEN